MLMQAIGCVVMALGMAITSTGAPELVAGMMSSASCKKSTLYDFANDTVRECRSIITCDTAGDKCERRSDTYSEDGKTVTVVFCSCEDISVSGEPTGVCHIFRHHKGATTFPHCTDGTDCAADAVCVRLPVIGIYPTVEYCTCLGPPSGGQPVSGQ